MNPEQREFLNLEKRPARLTPEQVAWLLGFQVHDIAQLASSGLLRALGNPGSNAPKFYACVEIEACAQDRRWLARATNSIQNYWKSQNTRRPERVTNRKRRNGNQSHLVQLLQHNQSNTHE